MKHLKLSLAALSLALTLSTSAQATVVWGTKTHATSQVANSSLLTTLYVVMSVLL